MMAPEKRPKRKLSKGKKLKPDRRTVGRKPSKKASTIPDTGMRCSASVKTCSKCGYHYPKGDNWHKTPNCPKCGREHRCPNTPWKSTPTCRVHGGPGGEQVRKDATFRIAHQIRNVFNKVIGDPQLMSLTLQQAVLVARFEELMRMLDDLDTRGNHEEIMGALATFEMLLMQAEGDRHGGKAESVVSIYDLRDAVAQLRRAVEPVRVEFALWQNMYNNIEISRRVSDTERRYLILNKAMVPLQHVMEALVLVERLTLKYIRAPEDRAAFGTELRRAIPIEAAAAAAKAQ